LSPRTGPTGASKTIRAGCLGGKGKLNREVRAGFVLLSTMTGGQTWCRPWAHTDSGHTLSPDPEHTLSPDPGHTLSPDPGSTLNPDPGHTLSSEPGHTLSCNPGHRCCHTACKLSPGTWQVSESGEVLLHFETQFLLSSEAGLSGSCCSACPTPRSISGK
jgi:hypothetical protein